MKTEIKIKTYMCPLGIGRLGQAGSCRFHKAVYDLTEGEICPTHGRELELAILPEDKITRTIAGPEDVEEEIVSLEYDAHFQKGKKNLSEIKEEMGVNNFDSWYGARLTRRGNDVSTVAKKEAYRSKRLQDIEQAILKAKEHEDK